MDMKKIISGFLALAFLVLLVLPAAAELPGVISMGRISAVMPGITVELKGTDFERDDITATLGGEKLDVVQAEPYDASLHSSCVYLLVDLSTSMESTFQLVKNNIVSFIETLGEDDKVVLITFGKTEVKTVLDGSESREAAKQAVSELKCNEYGTVFYEALRQVYQLSTSSNLSYDREYAITFSDGIDYQKGNSTFDEALKLYDSHALPLYAVCPSNTSSSAADKFGELARTSGGGFYMVDSQAAFSSFMAELNQVTILKLLAGTNFADGSEKQLSVKIGSTQIEYNVPITRSIPDEIAPTVESLTYDEQDDTFVIAFSEKVVGASDSSAYKITDAEGNKIEVSEVFYSEKNDTYEIKMKSPLAVGAYLFEFSGIKDSSQEANALSGNYSVQVEKSKAVPPESSEADDRDNITTSDEEPKGLSTPIIILIVAVVLIVIAVVVLLIVFSAKKRNREENDVLTEPKRIPEQEVEYLAPEQGVAKHHIKLNDTARIKLRIRTGNSSEQNVVTNIISSLIVGRSDTCDIYIDDTKLSRQHFVLERDNDCFYIMDLQSRNGTMLNGIRISGRQQIKSGDKIMAGLSDIVFYDDRSGLYHDF